MCPALLTDTVSAFHRVDAEEAPNSLDSHAEGWWRSSGYALAVLLDKAGYSDEAQCRLLRFIRAVIPLLGSFEAHSSPSSPSSPFTATTPPSAVLSSSSSPASPSSPSSGGPRWKSFMTDDHTPIEVSWDWRTGDQTPKIRFSIEPVGLHAGTPLDPENQYAGLMLLGYMARTLPHTRLTWLAHFQRELCGSEAVGSVEGHPSKEFYAFDLGEDGEIVSKAYFFPGFRASARGQSNGDVIADTIISAPGSSPDKLRALSVFLDYVNDPRSPPVEMDMLSIDLIEPEKSRFKIYFRVRDGSFASIRDTMTLGGRLDHLPGMDVGLHHLRQFYHGSGGLNGGPQADHVSLLDVQCHRTSGILYNAEFRYGSNAPRIKAYLPVRHYAQSEQAVIHALEKHFRHTQSPKADLMATYQDAISSLFPQEAINTRSGLHTYISCLIEPSGELRMISYVNPRQAKYRPDGFTSFQQAEEFI